MDYGFMRASSSDFSKTLRSNDHVVYSYDGYTSYLLIVDEASRYIWVFPTSSKDPPLDLVLTFLRVHGHINGSSIRTDQGGELARSHAFQDMLLQDHSYILEPTGSDSPSQNGAVEIYNDKFRVKTRTLLYGSGLPAKYWSAALCHSVYLHNWLVHHKTKITPFEGYYGARIYHDLKYLALAFVLNGSVTAPENLITIRSRAFFWVTLQPIITSTTLTSRPVSLKPAIMQSLTKHGTSRHNVRRRLNFYMTLV
jgi:hypothetical protein